MVSFEKFVFMNQVGEKKERAHADEIIPIFDGKVIISISSSDLCLHFYSETQGNRLQENEPSFKAGQTFDCSQLRMDKLWKKP